MHLTAVTLLIYIANSLSDHSHQYSYPKYKNNYLVNKNNQCYGLQCRYPSKSNNLQRNDNFKHLSSHKGVYKTPVRNPHIKQPNTRYQNKLSYSNYYRKPILIQPSNYLKPYSVPASRNYRQHRKISPSSQVFKHNYNFAKEKSRVETQKNKLSSATSILETKVKTSQLPTSGHNAKPQVVKSSQNREPVVTKFPVKRKYNSAPAQPKFIIQQAGPSQQFGWVGHGTYAPVNVPNIFKAAGINTRWTPGIDPIFQVGLLYPSSPTGSTQTSYSSQAQSIPSVTSNFLPSSVKVKKSIANSLYDKQKQSITKIKNIQPLIEQPALPPPYAGPPQPTIQYTAYEPPAIPPQYVAKPQFIPSSIALPVSNIVESPAVPPEYLTEETPAPPPPFKAEPPKQKQTFSQTTIKPFVNLRVSTTSDYVNPTTYKPVFVSSTSRPFSLVIGKEEETPKKQLSTTKLPKKKEEEVYYIFYENNDDPLEPIKTGIDLQKYIEEEIENAKKSTSAQKQQELSSRSFENSPTLNEPVYFDVPIKIEENGEGFTPPSEIRNIFVPQDKSENGRDIIDVNVGTSYGYDKYSSSRFPSFSEKASSSYSNPITSYDAPITHTKSFKKIRKIKKDKVNVSDSSLPFGTRLEST